MLRRVRCAGVMARASTSKVEKSRMMTFDIRGEREVGRPSEWQRNAKRDEAKVAVQQDCAVDRGERTKFFGHTFRLGQEGVPEKTAKCQVACAAASRVIHAVAVTESSSQPEQRGHR